MEQIVTHGKTPLQQTCMDYGTSLRRIRGLKSNARAVVAGHELFSKDERDLIETICQDAEGRAERKYREDRTETETRGGSSSEQRQYTGK